MSCVDAVCEQALAHLLGPQSDDQSEGRLGELLSRTVTLYWLAQVLNDHAVTGVDDYIRLLQQRNSCRGAGDSSQRVPVIV